MHFFTISSSPVVGVYCRQTQEIGNSLTYTIGTCPPEFDTLVGTLPDNDRIYVRGGRTMQRGTMPTRAANNNNNNNFIIRNNTRNGGEGNVMVAAQPAGY
eukprot:PhF_6_TR44471/c0_g1_i2/m.68466